MTQNVPLSEIEALALWNTYKDDVYKCTRDSPHLNYLAKKSFRKIKHELAPVGTIASICGIVGFSILFCATMYFLIKDYKDTAANLLAVIKDMKIPDYQRETAENNLKKHSFPFAWVFFAIVVYSVLMLALGYFVLAKNQMYINKINNSFRNNHIEYIWNTYPNVIQANPYYDIHSGETYAALDDIKIEIE
jgi:hypothetical protein